MEINKNSFLGKYYRFAFGDYPKSTCQAFHWLYLGLFQSLAHFVGMVYAVFLYPLYFLMEKMDSCTPRNLIVFFREELENASYRAIGYGSIFVFIIYWLVSLDHSYEFSPLLLVTLPIYVALVIFVLVGSIFSIIERVEKIKEASKQKNAEKSGVTIGQAIREFFRAVYRKTCRKIHWVTDKP